MLSVIGKPIINAECLCSDCHKAGALLQVPDGAPDILDQNSATRFVIHRKDKVEFHSGHNKPREHHLAEDALTGRYESRPGG